uniref:glycerophosphoinositol inositolphosphodiesterase GDPD2 isoform X4 n=1 Tax=Doryrhamphus excisus TaxID=161450 RepID=UPI0025AE2D96|nr:glycerophosphoinositol inositolphosphodiesterase GDPD2 isoform X4 [Doryrhamphus excisus]
MSAFTACCRACSRGLYSCRWKRSRKGEESQERLRETEAVGELGRRADHHVCGADQLLRAAAAFCLVPHRPERTAPLTLASQVPPFLGFAFHLCRRHRDKSSVETGMADRSSLAPGSPASLSSTHEEAVVFCGDLISLPLCQATAPFLQLGAVWALVLLSPLVFQGCQAAKTKRSGFLMAAVYAGVSAAILLCPLLIRSPCLIDPSDLPHKPKLIGHRGAPMLAPENTIMSFRRSIACGVTAFETDVQLSKDGVPFLMHDQHPGFLRRTTDVEDKFPGRDLDLSTDVTWAELESLNAGEWFLQTDPFRSLSQLSEEDKEEARNQTIPSLLQLLLLAKHHNISILFDLYGPDQENHTADTVSTILMSKVDPSLVLWLPSQMRDYVKTRAPGFIQIYNNEEDMLEEGGDHLNVQYSKLSVSEIRALRSQNVTVNVWVVNDSWLFSLLWCAGVSSVTTNSCHLLRDMRRPNWVMPHATYSVLWVTVDVAAVAVATVLYFVQRKRLCCHREVSRKDQNSWNEKELSPFFPAV